MGKPTKGKPRLADGMHDLADAARSELVARPCSPRILIERLGDNSWRFSSPYDSADLPDWEALLFQAFGTRSSAIMNHFLSSFHSMVGDGVWNEKRRYWMPDQDEFDAVVAIVASLKPENEAQAAHAAQLAALHLSAMRLSRQATASNPDPRAVAILTKTVRAYGEGMQRLARVQGKIQPRQVNQTIEVHYHDHRDQRVQIANGIAGGVPSNGGRPQRTERGATIQRAALPSPDESGSTVPIASRGGQEGVQVSWWGERLWRAVRSS